MITAIKYLPILLASTATVCSVLYKVLKSDTLHLSLLVRDFVVFFVVYYVVWLVCGEIYKIIRNGWKLR
ncbi:hypothetical protein RsTz2092_01010 [Deferribacterales bacterium RsTz2092]